MEIFGVPPHGWIWENFKGIANSWGRLINLGKSFVRTDSFESMKILIVNDHFHRIEANFILSLEDSGYRIKVKEISLDVQLIQSSTPTMGATDSSDGVLGSEDVNEVASTDDREASDSRRNDMSDEQALEVF